MERKSEANCCLVFVVVPGGVWRGAQTPQSNRKRKPADRKANARAAPVAEREQQAKWPAPPQCLDMRSSIFIPPSLSVLYPAFWHSSRVLEQQQQPVFGPCRSLSCVASTAYSPKTLGEKIIALSAYHGLRSVTWLTLGCLLERYWRGPKFQEVGDVGGRIGVGGGVGGG